MRLALYVGAFAVAILLPGCGGAESDEVRIFAASSLTEVMTAIVTEIADRTDATPVELHFDGTPRLIFQLLEGAPADVLVTADEQQMQRAMEAGLLAAEPQLYARNRLALVVGEGNPKTIIGLADLAREDLRVALCGPEVPAGRYARKLLAESSLTITVCSEEPSVRSLLAKIALGEVDAGLVYRTDLGGVLGVSGAVEAVPLGDTAIRAEYFVAPLLQASSADRATELVDELLSVESRRILQAHGFENP